MSSNKATGLDGMPARVIKDGATQITALTTHMINLSLYSDNVPDAVKIARVVPLYKNNSKTDPGNYLPVSILSVVSKRLERLVYNSTTTLNLILHLNFFTLYSQAFAALIQPIPACLTYLTNHLHFQMDKGFYTGKVGLMIDLQKAFDTVDHGILLRKLKALGFHDLSVSYG